MYISLKGNTKGFIKTCFTTNYSQQIRLRGVRSTDHEVHGCTEPGDRGTINIMGLRIVFLFEDSPL